MAVPTSQSLVQNAFLTLWEAFISVQSGCTMVQNFTANGASASASAFLTLANYCVSLKSLVTAYQANTTLWNGVIAYASNAAPGGMTITDLTNAYNASNTLLNALAGEYPHDAGGHLTDRTYSLTNGLTWISLTAAQMPNTMTAITGYLATLS
jgi:uncharacterized protein YebE (UPF0316 family)